MAKLLYVVHRYAPYPGGSEMNTQRYAEASVALGHDVTVFAQTHKGDYNGVKLTSNPNCLSEKWDMIIVHGDGPAQNIVHFGVVNGPVMYLLIKPFVNSTLDFGLARAKWIGCATSFDADFVERKGYGAKKHFIKYPIPIVEPNPAARLNLYEHYGLQIPPNRKIILSCGGFWSHKGFKELASVFSSTPLLHSSLILTGYDMVGYDKSLNDISHVQQILLQDTQLVRDVMSLADYYIMNSSDEGYGLVLLEAMQYGLNWASRPVGGAPDLAKRGFGKIFNTPDELSTLLRSVELGENGFGHISDASKSSRISYVRVNHDPLKVTREMLSVGVQ